MDQNQLEKIQQRAAEILADIIGRQYGLEITVHVERRDSDDRPRAANDRGIHSESA